MSDALDLPADVRVCADGDWLIFLDLSRDRYWAIARALGSERIREDLRRAGVIGPRPKPSPCAPRFEWLWRRLPDWLAFAEAALWAWTVERRGALSSAFAWFAAVHPGLEPPPTAEQEDLLNAAARMRLWTPHRYVCLFDSLCLGRFLVHRGCRVSIVFGVRARPFAAHCWLETGGLVVDGTEEDWRSFKEIARTE